MSDEQTAEAADDPEETEEESGLQAGDFVELAYTARTVDGGELVDTTDRSPRRKASRPRAGTSARGPSSWARATSSPRSKRRSSAPRSGIRAA
jgi:hypothetical protein